LQNVAHTAQYSEVQGACHTVATAMPSECTSVFARTVYNLRGWGYYLLLGVELNNIAMADRLL